MHNFFRRSYTSRLFLCRQQIESMLRWAETEEDVTHSAMAMLFLVTYVFLLRLPSEALPIEVGRVPGKQQQAVLEMDDGKLILTLMRRKNRPAGSKLERTCWCQVQRVVQNLSGACVGASCQRHPARHRSFRRIHSRRGQQRTQGHAWKDWRSQGKGIPDTRHKAWARAGSPTLRCFCTCSVAQAALATLCVYGRSPTLEDFGRWRVAISSVP